MRNVRRPLRFVQLVVPRDDSCSQLARSGKTASRVAVSRGPALLVAAFAASLLLYNSGGSCGFNGLYCDDVCGRLESSLQERLVGQELATQQLLSLVCDHVAQARPTKPLVLSLHGPPGVGKSLFHSLLADALYNFTGLGKSCEAGSLSCPGYRVVFGTDFFEEDRARATSLLRTSIRTQLLRHPETLLVVEEFDKADCDSRAILRQVIDTGMVGNVSARRSIIVLESNTGSRHMVKLLQRAGSRDALTPEAAQRSLKDVTYNASLRQQCESPVDTQKLLSLVDAFVPFLPLERRHVRSALAGLLRDRRAAGVQSREFGDLLWDGGVLEFLTSKVEFEADEAGFAMEGAKEGSTVMSRHTSPVLRALQQQRAAHAAMSIPPRIVRLRVQEGSLIAEID